MTRFFSVLFAPVLLLLGCQTNKVADPSSPYYPPPQGSIVTLHTNLEIPPETSRIFLQRGKIYGYTGFDRYYPWCYFQLNTIKNTTQTLNADTFEVYKVVSRTEQVVENGPIQLAGIRSQFGAEFNMAKSGGDGPSTETAIVQMWLRSEKQPEIRKLVCGGAEDNPAIARAPSIDEIRAALGEIATLRLTG